MPSASPSILSLIVFGFIAFVYFLPSLTAFRRREHFIWILALNLPFGWTGFGWMAALVWAISPPSTDSRGVLA